MRHGGRRQIWMTAAVLGLWLGGGAAIMAAGAGTFPVFGPETFTRATGKPVTVTRTVTVPSPTATAWVLHLDNGGSQGELGRVTSAEVKLNGTRIFGPADFKAGVSVLEKPVGLAASNQLTVEIAGAPGSGFSLRIDGRDVPPPAEPPEVHITAPGPGLVTSDGFVTVTGTINRSVLAVAVNGVEAVLQGTTFTALDVPLSEGINRLLATAQTGMGESASDSVSVRRDTHPPQVVIETPRNGERLVNETVTVAGTVNDIIPGATVNADDVRVTLNGVPAAVDNRTFLVPDVPLSLGENVLTAEAVDRAGNRRTNSVRVTREPGLAGLRVVIAGGNNQRGPVKTTLPEPLAVRLLGPDGRPLPNRPVELAIVKGDGLLGSDPTGQRQVTVLTDGDGMVSVPFTVGSRTGEGFHRVRATTPGSLTFAEFCATALPGAPSRIATARRPPLRGVAGQPTSEPLSVIVTDSSGNPVADVPVTFAVEFGGGTFGGQIGGQASATIPTNPDGIAEAVFTLGASPGRANNQISADFPGNPGMPTVFLLSGYAAGPPAETRVSGTVQNNLGQPIVGAEVEVEDTEQKTVTGPDGRFSIHVPPGGHHVSIDGADANDPEAGIFYPYLELAVEAISGADNPLDQVVVLPFLDMANARMVGGDEDVVLGIKDVPGFALKVFAHSTIRPDGTRGPIRLSSSQVSFDKVPMPPPEGSTPLFFGTLQPGGIHFDPPAQVTYPNVNGLAPGDVADLFSFDHHVGQFVNVGPGTVSEDGTVVTSDPGFGIVATGWHGVTRIPGPTGQAANGCGGQFEWQYVQSDGSLSSIQSGPVSLFLSDDAKTARVRAPFNPGGGTFLSASWTGGNPLVARSDENAGGNVSFLTVTAGSTPGDTGLISPVYEFRDPMGAVVSCQVPVQAGVGKVEIEINDTPDDPADDSADDDFVWLKNDLASDQLMVKARARLVGGPGNIDVVLTSPKRTPDAGQLGFLDRSFNESNSLTLKLTKDGPWVNFNVFGSSKSKMKNDAVIEARCGSKQGPACGEESATVFYFESKVEVTLGPAPSYVVPSGTSNAKVYGPVRTPAVNLTSRATLKPDNLNCSKGALEKLNVGIIQNAKAAGVVEYAEPKMSCWAKTVSKGFKVDVAATLTDKTPPPQFFQNDSNEDVKPLYDKPGKGNVTLDPNSLKRVVCNGQEVVATSNDTPGISYMDPSLEEDVIVDGKFIGRLTYKFMRVAIDDSFRTWSVAYDEGTDTVVPLWQVDWQLNADSSLTGEQKPVVPDPQGKLATDRPETGKPYAVADAKARRKTIKGETTTTLIKGAKDAICQ